MDDFVRTRYAEWESEFGRKIMESNKTLDDLEDHVLRHGEPERKSGRQEMLENLVNEFIL